MEEKGKKKREKRGVWHFIRKEDPNKGERRRKNMDAKKIHGGGITGIIKLRILLTLMMLLMIFLVRPWKVQAAETAEAKGTVQWTSTYGMSVPDSVTLYLLRDGKETGDTTTATKNGGWTFSFGQKPLRDGNGKAYTYSVKEDTSNLEEGYTAVSSEFNADKVVGQKISMNSSSKTESGYDYLVFYYKDNDGAWKKSPKIGGSIGGKSYIIPAKDFYIYWHTDSSGTYYGFKIDSIEAISDKSDLTFTNADALPNYTAVEKAGTDYPETGHNYGNNEDKLWHYTAGNTVSIFITNKGKYIAGGTWGTCPWTIDDAGTLTIGAGTGEAVGYSSPWMSYSDKIVNIKTSGVVVLPQNSAYLFSGLEKAKSIDLSGFNTANVTDMHDMFDSCSSLTSLNLSNFNTASVTNMHNMFYSCSSLTSLNLSNFNTEGVMNMSCMFSRCSSLLSLDLSNFDTANATTMYGMFSGCSSLSSLDLSNFNTAKVTSMDYMFNACSNLSSLDLSNFNTAKVVDMEYMFNGCSSLSSLDLSNFNTANVKKMGCMFYGCSSLLSLDLSSFDTANVVDMDYMFSGCSSLLSLDLSNFDTAKATNMYGMFNGCSHLSSLDLSSFDTANVTKMNYMFNGCSHLSSLSLSSFNTEGVMNMSCMFSGCSSLLSLDLSSFNTANVVDMDYMFSGCSSLLSLDLSNFDTAKATNMYGMFNGCSHLSSLDLSSFDTANVTKMNYMFNGCSHLSSLSLSSFNTEGVMNMSCMFSGCSSLLSLDLSSFNTANVVDMDYMFNGCSSLKSIKLGAKSGLTDKTGGSSSFSSISPKAKEGEDITYTGKWTKTSPYNHAGSISGSDLQTNYATNSSGFGNFEEATWVWEIEGQDPYGQKYSADDGKTNGKHNVVSLASDTSAETQIDAFATDKDGNKTGYWTKLDDGTWTYTFYVYKANVPWKVYEDDLTGYTGNYTKASPLDIDTGTDEAIITNTSDRIAKQKYGTLKITKKLDGSAATNISFSFEITLTDENGKSLSGNTMFGGIAFSNGKATVSVDAGNSTEVSGIPVGYHYSIKEIPAHGYRQESFTNQNDVVPEGTTEAVCTNKYLPLRKPPAHVGEKNEVVGLTINKICESQTDKFKFNISISSLNAGETVDAEIKTTSSSAAQKTTYTPDGNGEINEEVEISGTGSIVLSGIPVGAKYRITEDASPYLASYSIADTNNKGLINKAEDANDEINAPLSTMEETADSGEDVKLTFTNAKPKYPVLFTKRDEKDDFVEGAVLEVSDSNGTEITSWTTAAGESKELSIEPGTYTLKEASVPSGYAKAADISFTVDDTGKIFIDGAEVSDVEMIDSSTETTVSISKIDDYAFPVAGAKLSIVDNSTGKTIDTWQTDNKSRDIKLSFGKTYTLSEDSAPAGYEKAANIKIEVGTDGSITIDGKKSSTAAVQMIDSRKTYILPSTGGTGSRRAAVLLISLSSLLLITFLSSKKSRRETSQEN